MLTASVIVPARNSAQTLPRTLSALAAQDFDGEYEVLVVDDGSSDATAELARNGPGPVRVLEQPPHGPAAARNLGVSRSRAECLAFCDADVYPTAGWLAAGIEALRTADLVQGKVLPDPTVGRGPFDRTIWVTHAAGLFETANLFVGRGTFDAVGGFEEWLRPTIGKALAEDLWFGYRALRLGARTGFSNDALAYHAVFPRDWREFVRERGRLQYFPVMARQMPELRRTFLYRRCFLNRRSAMFDLALAALAVRLVGGPRFVLGAGLPYLRELQRLGSRDGGDPLRVIPADVAADAVGLIALVGGSLRCGSPVA